MSTEEADPVLLILITDHRSQQVPAEHHTPLPSAVVTRGQHLHWNVIIRLQPLNIVTQS